MRSDWNPAGLLVLTSAVLKALGVTLLSPPCLLTILFLAEVEKEATLLPDAFADPLLNSAPPLLTAEVVLKALDSILALKRRRRRLYNLLSLFTKKANTNTTMYAQRTSG